MKNKKSFTKRALVNSFLFFLFFFFFSTKWCRQFSVLLTRLSIGTWQQYNKYGANYKLATKSLLNGNPKATSSVTASVDTAKSGAEKKNRLSLISQLMKWATVQESRFIYNFVSISIAKHKISE